ncbi:2,3-diphosphoglycerate-dependent phosphoglycerate mutase [Azospirillum sp. RWY-5-1]|uniref:2,3-bisphosphoglycerate-dependent phosphoglycerate mutase n=1 Tax=Azospirillum oleiclasticum TaxID=2735135 RepID=A0ABX2TE16_9PROT|nr:2,3-diphosphoglycerate-dependent phosphoglycerate mutase [Azospirillum oleiclasticum]NYZ15404.1 2,3-diphosphoglycerate-dependent phosphoglycerate mutase [Azospirillum oleiclasticum]NYZ22426.1 2,3-diphosphoglycerate-dependent phosphoglycerate mutase [Azospirillum oleiclasticum]
MHRLVLIRHGQSDWNRRNLFTGWTDVPLTEAGLAESRSAAAALKAAGFDLDVAFTSVLTRAIVTLHTVLGELDRLWLPVHKHWRLNERHYGALQGLDKHRTAERHGDAMVALWRRSWDVPPPPIDPADPRSALDDRRYAGLAASQRPRGESLKDTMERVLPYWTESIVPALRLGARAIVAAHGNSLRGLVKHLDGVPDDVIPQVEIPTGRPLVYELDTGLAPLRRYFLHPGGAAEPAEWRRE